MLVVGLAVVYVTAFIAVLSSPWVPSRKKDYKKIISAINPKKGEIVYDLGSGDGRLCMEIARRTKSTVVGVELSFIYYGISRLRVLLSGLGNRVKIRWGNFYRQSISDADKVFLYLTSRTATQLAHKLSRELKEGALVITYQYPIQGWNHMKKIQNNKNSSPIYLYRLDKKTQKPVI